MKVRDWLRGERGFLLLLVAGGTLIRLLWLWRTQGVIDGLFDAGEATRVALAFARGDGIADAYYPGQGSTAHLLPLNPMIAGGILWLFGPQSTAASIALLTWSLGQTFCGYLLVRALFQRLGADSRTLRWGSALLFLVPPFIPQELIDFRYWEGGSALCLAAGNLLVIARLRDAPPPGWRMITAIAALSASTFFVSPPVGLAVDLCWAIYAVLHLPSAKCAQIAVSSAFALTILIAPWAIRNERVLGAFVPLRSNFGIELALANHPAALSSRTPENVFAERLDAIHPSANPALRPIIAQRGGELRYAQSLARSTEDWIAAHPLAFAQLWLRHLSEFFFPRAWQMYFTGWEGMREARAITISLVQLLGLIGLIANRRRYALVLVYIAGIALPFALFQPMSRYIFLAWPLLAFPAAEAVLKALRRTRPVANQTH